MLCLLADENIPGPIIRVLRETGFEVRTMGQGADDQAVLHEAGLSGCVLLTADRDFGALVYALRREAPIGVIYIHLGMLRLGVAALRLIDVLHDEQYTFPGRFTVIGPGRVRQRPLPSS